MHSMLVLNAVYEDMSSPCISAMLTVYCTYVILLIVCTQHNSMRMMHGIVIISLIVS
jgi:hypothetical protein